MSGEAVYEAGLRALERYGFGIALAVAVLWFVRVDIVLPMIESHQLFLRELSMTQKDIATAVQEQTRLLWALQPAKQEQAPE